MVNECLNDFFTDFAVNATLETNDQQVFIRGILKAPMIEPELGYYQISGQGFEFVCPSESLLDLEDDVTLIIENKSYRILKHIPDGTGISTLSLEVEDKIPT